jgi:hypothetical protein
MVEFFSFNKTNNIFFFSLWFSNKFLPMLQLEVRSLSGRDVASESEFLDFWTCRFLGFRSEFLLILVLWAFP